MLFNDIEIEILKNFLGDYSRRVYGREIAKKQGMNQKTVSSTLIKLERKNILKFSKEGRNKYYFLNTFNPNLKEVINVVEIHNKIAFFERHKAIRDLFDELEKRTKGILVIFGSYANGTEKKDSDLDPFVIGNIDVLYDIEKTYDIKINIVKAKSKDLTDNLLFKEVVKNHVILKGLEEFIKLKKW